MGRRGRVSYGPLAFVNVPSVLTNASLPLGLLYGALCVSLIVAVPFYGLRELRLWLAAGITFGFCLVAPTTLFVPELISVGAFAVALSVFELPQARWVTLASVLFGALLAVQMLVEPPAAVAVLVAIVVLALAPVRGSSNGRRPHLRPSREAR